MSFFFMFRFIINLVTVVWTNTTVEIPVYEDINDYIEVPQAYLYEDGQKIEGLKTTYKTTGVDRTFLSTVNTDYVKPYRIYYEAYFETYDIRDKAQITFNVVDRIAPEITHIPLYEIDVGQDIPNLLTGLIYVDNYDASNLLTIQVDDYLIDNHHIGTYELTYTIKDQSLNTMIYEVPFLVVDRKAPIISLNKPLVANYNESITFDEYISITDNYDTQPYVLYDDSRVDYDQLGTYQVYVTAYDQSDNEIKEIFTLEIVDKNPPQMILKSYPEPIPVYQDVTIDLLKTYILQVIDDYDDLNIDDVEVMHDIDHKRIGTYHIYYRLYDTSGNMDEKTLDIKVMDLDKPEITLIKPLEFEVFSQPSSYLSYFEFTDNYSEDDQLDITIETKPKFDVIGSYDFLIEVEDESGQIATYRDEVKVVDLIPPEIIELSDIVITDFKEKDLTIYFRAEDNYDQENIKVTVDDQLVDYNKTGIYDIEVTATDVSQNKKVLNTTLAIIDISEPILKLSTDMIYLDVFEESIDLKSYIDTANDNYDQLDIENVIITDTIKYDKVGRYQVQYSLLDQALNQTIETLEVMIIDNEPPKVVGYPIYIKMYEPVDVLKGLTITDNVDILNIYYDSNMIDTSMPGIYEMSYVIMDVNGNKTLYSRLIYVEEIEKTYVIEDFTPLILITLTAISILYVMYKKM